MTSLTTSSSTISLPRWDTDRLFPSLGSRELAAAHEVVVADVARLAALLDAHGVQAGTGRPVTDADRAALDELLPAFNRLLERMRLVGAFLHAHTSTDATDAEAATLQSRFQADTARLAPLTKRFQAWVASLGADALLDGGSDEGRDHAFALQRAARAAQHQMSDAEEDLAAELALTGGRAWAKLHSDVTARLTAQVAFPDQDGLRVLPMSAVRALAAHPDRTVRQAAFDSELEAWRTVEVPLAAALNAFKGEANSLNRRRHWPDSLDVSLWNNNVDRATIEAMQEAVVHALPAFARFHRTKAVWLRAGQRHHRDDTDSRSGERTDEQTRAAPQLAWWDLLAPVGSGARFGWGDATAAVADAFASFSPRLADLVRRAVDERWLDAEPRQGKVGGAFCMPVQGDVSRVLLNFDGSFDSVQTLAHELGHAYHNTQLGHRTPLQRQMALAETASIFCETVMVQAGLAAAGDDAGAQIAILDGDLVGAAQVVVDIHSRFLFERALTTGRERGVLAPERLCELMVDAQRGAYLDGLDPVHLHPWMWAVKGHYFTAYYNWPYTFGLLFGIGLYAEYQRDPERFGQSYDDLLSATGLDDAAPLAARFGIDVRDVTFWTSSLDVLRERIDRFCVLAAGP